MISSHDLPEDGWREGYLNAICHAVCLAPHPIAAAEITLNAPSDCVAASAAHSSACMPPMDL
jgi:hypothetical protein